jgi:AcrR family transcriptional regulator
MDIATLTAYVEGLDQQVKETRQGNSTDDGVREAIRRTMLGYLEEFPPESLTRLPPLLRQDREQSMALLRQLPALDWLGEAKYEVLQEGVQLLKRLLGQAAA